MSFAQMLRDIDDAGLDVYEFRLWCHIWRVGVSWESVRTMAKKCGMSVGRTSKAKATLLERNFLAYEERNGRLGLAAVVCSPREQIQQLDDHHVNEYNDEPVAVVHVVNESVHHVNSSVHHVNAILSMPIEDSLLKGEGDRANGNGRTAAPPPPDEPPNEPERPQRIRAVGDLANAITEVTGISARLNWHNGVGELAESLYATGFTADQLRRHYSRQPVPGAWNWYDQDWRGKKGEPPSLKGIRETIAGATRQAPAARKLGQIEQALARFGNGPNPATT